MVDPAPSNPPPADDPQGSLGAVLIGGAILLIAGIFIFWPQSDSATGTASRTAGQGAAGQQGSNAVAGDGRGSANGGFARGIDPRDIDPAHPGSRPGQGGQGGDGRVGPALNSANLPLAPAPKPEPTSFASKAEEIAYVEQRLVQARADLESRTTFLERMQKLQQENNDERNAARAKIVQQNYEAARAKVDELIIRLKGLRGAK